MWVAGCVTAGEAIRRGVIVEQQNLVGMYQMFQTDSVDIPFKGFIDWALGYDALIR